MDKQNFLAPEYNGKFPISADTFDFMQNQIGLIDRIAYMLTGNTGVTVVREPTSISDGLIAFKGEFLPLKYTSSQGEDYVLYEDKESISAQGQLFEDARIRRFVKRASTTAGGIDSKSVNLVKDFTEPLSASVVPIGGIIMWSGTDVPYNYALCNGQVKNGVQTPNLSGRFIVASGSNGTNSYGIGDTGGEDTHTLTVDEIPSHNHTYQKARGGINNYGGSTNSNPLTSIASSEVTTGSKGGGQPHENRPSYYALAYIMRVK